MEARVARNRVRAGTNDRSVSYGSDQRTSLGKASLFDLLDRQLGTDVDATLDAPGDRTEASMEAMDPFGCLLVFGSNAQGVCHVDPLDDQYAVFLLDLADRLGRKEPIACRDLARFQRAAKGPCESTSGRRDHIVEGGGVWFMNVCIHAVMFCHLGVYAEENWLLLNR